MDGAEPARLTAVVVRAVAPAELPAVERALGPGAYAGQHARRLAWQARGEATYLIAWRGEQPLDHLLVRWNGAARDDVPAALRERPYLEAAAVRPAWQSRGVGTRLFEAAHELAWARSVSEVGLAVSVENVRARDLYGRLGYREADIAPFRLTWSYTDAEGRPGTEGEDCVYMVKRLVGPHPHPFPQSWGKGDPGSGVPGPVRLTGPLSAWRCRPPLSQDWERGRG